MHLPNKLFLISFCLSIVFCSTIFAQDCNTNRYLSASFNSSQIFSDITYTKDVSELQFSVFGNETVANADLAMDIRMPPNTDTVTKRPAIIWVHSGGFILGNKTNDDMQAIIDTFARRGYVTASLHYRLGMNIFDDVSAERAVYRGTQDASAAIRFFRENADLLGIDPNLIFIAGSSAGAVAALHLAYIEDSERPASTFAQAGTTALDLGNVHSHQIEKITNENLTNPISSSINSLQSGIPNAVIACWGGIGNLDWINTTGNTPPAILFHGLDDNVVFSDCQQPFQNFGTMPILCGSEEIDTKLTAITVTHETHLYEGEGHEFWGATNGDFGGDNEPNNPALWQETIDKIGVFLYNFIPQPFTPNINGLTAICPNTSSIYDTDEVSGVTYCWEVNGGTVSIDDGSSIEVLWNEEGMGSVSLQMTNEHGIVSDVNELLVNIAPIRVKVKVLLEGMFNENGSTISLLDKGLLPNQQPYNIFPWNYAGTESANTSLLPPNTVDWVLVEARNPNNKFEVLDRTAGLLLSNGNIVAADNPTQDVVLCNLQHGENYHLVVRHRNHLDIMSSTAITLPNTFSYDFTLAVNQAEGTNQLVNVGTSGFAMRLGDVNGDGVMTLLDFNTLMGEISQLNQYLSADFNFDGHVVVRDFNAYQKNASAIGVEEVRY